MPQFILKAIDDDSLIPTHRKVQAIRLATLRGQEKKENMTKTLSLDNL